MQRPSGSHEIENVRAGVSVRVSQEYRMQAQIEGLAEKLLVEGDGVETEEYSRRPRRENTSDFTNHVVVGLPRHVRRVRK
jgi:hypothetical protein